MARAAACLHHPLPLHRLTPFRPFERKKVTAQQSLAALANQRQHLASAAPTAAAAVVPRGSRLLECSAGREDSGLLASASSGVEAGGGDARRVYETWRWRGYNINFRVEGGLWVGLRCLAGRGGFADAIAVCFCRRWTAVGSGTKMSVGFPTLA